jgi:hypothetical protein
LFQELSAAEVEPGSARTHSGKRKLKSGVWYESTDLNFFTFWIKRGDWYESTYFKVFGTFGIKKTSVMNNSLLKFFGTFWVKRGIFKIVKNLSEKI